MSETLRIAVMEGDGIGPEIVTSTVDILGHALRSHGVPVEWLRLPVGLSAVDGYGTTLPECTLTALRETRGWILGPVSTHEYPHGDTRYINPSGRLRKAYNLYANVRPAHAWDGINCATPTMDAVIVRENTEGFYADRNVLDGNGELRPDDNTVISVRVITRGACMRIAHTAFAIASQRTALKRVTAVHKANVLRRGDGLFLECCRAVAAAYPDVGFDDCMVDAFAMRLVLKPDSVGVVVTTNMFGDILSDEAAGLVGGLGLAPGLNIGDEHAMAQAVHGSAPDIAGMGVANPVAEVLSGAMLLRWLGERLQTRELVSAADDVEQAVAAALRAGEDLTPDLGGTGSTVDMTTAIERQLPRG